MASKRGRAPTFSRDELIDAAIRLGPDLTLKELADSLGVARTSLYWHVRDQAAVGELVLARLAESAGTLDWAPDDDATWDEWLRAWALRLRRTLLATGPWVRYATSGFAYSPRSLALIDRMLAVLLKAGFSPDDAMRAFTFVYQVVFASIRATAEPPVRALIDELASEVGPTHDHLLALRALSEAIERVSPDDQFNYDLGAALSGIAAQSGVAITAV